VALVGEQSGADGPARIAAITGADGRFLIKGLAPGPLGLAIDTARGAGTAGYSRTAYPSGGWSLDVPAAGVADVALKATTNPVVFALGKVGPDAALWWFPDGERPRAVLRLGFVFASYDLPVRPGWVWGHPGDARGAWCARLTPVPGTNTLTMDGDSPALGLTLPFDVTAQPGAVTLVGQVAREGFQVTIAAPVWQPSPQLGLYVASIDAVPPGCYTVRVATARGAVEATAVVTEHGGFVALVP
jgi:hypothetical protein